MRRKAVAVVPPSPVEVEGVIDLDPYYPEKLHATIQKAQELASDRVRDAAVDLVLNGDDVDDFDRNDLLEILADAVHSYVEVVAIHNAYAEQEHSANISVPANNGTANKN